jgi:1,4-dihydroxy-2-naphthoate polyprenyltransferase
VSWETLKSSDPRLRSILRDFRHPEKSLVYRIKADDSRPSSLISNPASDHLLLVETVPMSQWKRPNFLVRWQKAARLPYLAITLLPLLLVICIALQSAMPLPWTKIALIFGFLTLIQISANFWGDVEDHYRGVDSSNPNGGSGVIQKLWIPAIHLRYAAMALMALALAFGLVLLTFIPKDLVLNHFWWMGLLGVLGAASYSGWPFHYKYFGLGEPILFLLTGPLLTIAIGLILIPSMDLLWLTAVSVPLALLATLRLHLGNTQRMSLDRAVGAKTIASALGFAWANYATLFLFFAPFLWILGLVALSAVSPLKLAGLLLLPLSLMALAPTLQVRSPLDPLFFELRNLATRLHLGLGMLYSLLYLLD